MENKVSDTQARTDAIKPNESFIVQAPAGSGKTELLVQRYLSLLASNVKAPEEIIAITFTRKAASEMRSRVIESLKLGLGDEPLEAYKQKTWALAKKALEVDSTNNWQLIRNPSRMRMTTIDSLCAGLTSSMPVVSKFGDMPDVVDDCTPLYIEAVRNLFLDLESTEAWQGALKTLIFHLDNRMDVLETLLVNMLRSREQWLESLMAFKGQDGLRGSLESAITTLHEELLVKITEHVPFGLWGEITTCVKFARDMLGKVSCELDEANLESFQLISEALLTKTGTLRKTADKRAGFPADNKEMKSRIKELLAALSSEETFVTLLAKSVSLPEKRYLESDWAVVDALLEVLPVLVAHLQVVFMSHSQVDFNEVSIRALESLGGDDAPTELALALDYQIRHLLVDEFQDTSQLQYRLLQALTRGWQGDDGRTLFLVGDPMQSIYRFRQADVSLFLQAQTHGLGEIKLQPLVLASNFRSSKDIVNWVNDTFSAVFPVEPDLLMGAIPYSESTASHSFEGVVINNAFECGGDEASWIANRIKQIKSQEPEASIAILGRNRSHLTDSILSLMSLEVPIQAVDIDNLSGRMVIQDLKTLLYALTDTTDRLSWLALLRSPTVGIELCDLLLIAKASIEEPVLDIMSECEGLSVFAQKRLNQIIPILSNALATKIEFPLSIWLKQTWQELGGVSTLDSESELQDVSQFFNLLENLGPWQLPEREILDAKIAKLYAQPKAEAGAVQIMTIHKSKGLEFDYVFMPGLNRGTRPEDQPLVLWDERLTDNGWQLLLAPIKKLTGEHSSLYTFLYKLEQEKSAFEAQRLLYVAATRAKKSLNLTAVVLDEKLKSGSFAKILSFEADIQMDTDAPTQERHPDDSKHPSGPIIPTLKRLPESYQHEFTPFEIESADDLNIPEWPSTQTLDRAIGIVVHRYLELFAVKSLEFADAFDLTNAAIFEQQLTSEGVNQSDMQYGISQIQLALTNTLKHEQGRWVLGGHEQGACELPVFERKGSRLIKRIIDRTFVENGVRWIVDYKTANLQKGETIESFIARESELYQNQLNNYSRLMRAIDQNQYKIKTALYFPLQGKFIPVLRAVSV